MAEDLRSPTLDALGRRSWVDPRAAQRALARAKDGHTIQRCSACGRLYVSRLLTPFPAGICPGTHHAPDLSDRRLPVRAHPSDTLYHGGHVP